MGRWPKQKGLDGKRGGGVAGGGVEDSYDEDADQKLYFLVHLRHDAPLLQPKNVDNER